MIRTRPRRITLARRVPLADAIDLTTSVYVGPDSDWASPILWTDVGGQYPSLDDRAVGILINRDFETLATHGTLHYPNWRHTGGKQGPVTFTYPTLWDIRTALAGRDLACYCEPDLPCHADVLIRLAGPIGICPECRDTKHRNCDNRTLTRTDEWIPCTCHNHNHPESAPALAEALES